MVIVVFPGQHSESLHRRNLSSLSECNSPSVLLNSKTNEESKCEAYG
ncbi:hypothetical protein COLO4_35844 [Corchorus olitorius]|uniref:Uncharacterized protein n=1 Tax=Corchorus olitorius TaxID=93759 RepID=A0A1R3GCT5_9ROSI|nr:hypothetical protein COLO4_35844 [Corchorus olitorius]